MVEPNARPLLILCTTSTDEEACNIAEALVARRLAACVNIVGPIRSIYRWEDRVQRDEERLLLIKSSPQQFDAVAEAIRALHSYDLPEVIALPIDRGDPGYLEWLAGCLGDG